MLEALTNHIFTIAGAGLVGLSVARIYYGPEFYEVPWQPLRKVFIPIAHKAAERSLGEEFYAAYDVERDEHVVTLDADPEDVIADLEEAGYVEEPLAGLKTDWNGNTEVASYAFHRGDKPFPGAPEWLRERQVHVTLFEAPGGGTIVTAHEEWNSWRPDLAEAHYRGETLDIQLGRDLAADHLDVQLDSAPE